MSKPRIPVYSTADAKKYKNAKDIKLKLPNQIVKPVLWEQLMHIFYERPKEKEIPFTFACGPGKSMKTLLYMNNRRAVNNSKLL